jgi:hypothetical protein
MFYVLIQASVMSLLCLALSIVVIWSNERREKVCSPGARSALVVSAAVLFLTAFVATDASEAIADVTQY